MIDKLPFGATGHLSSRTIFGGAAFWTCDQAEADRTLDLLMQYGINHIDTAASYGDSELRIGPWMKTYRSDFFLATKTLERTYQKAWDDLRRSLDRLQTDHVDLIQLHFLIDEGEWEVAMGPGGALEAVIEARRQGLTRFIGVTGHELVVPKMHMRSLERFPFDSVLLPYNFPVTQEPGYAASFDKLAAICTERNIAVQTIKGLARRRWGDQAHTHITWYQPLVRQEDIDRAVWWVLGRRGLFLNTPGDLHVLPMVLDAASRYKSRPTDEEMLRMTEQQQMASLFN